MSVDNVKFLEVQNNGWTQNAVKRFELIYNSKEYLELFDFVFFYQSNTEFLLPTLFNDFFEFSKLTVIKHPFVNDLNPYNRSYERRKISSACIKYGKEPEFYYASGGFGGPTEIVIKLSFEVFELIKSDHESSIMAIWHDESYFNKCIIGFPKKTLESNYIYPEAFEGGVKIIQMREKNMFFDAGEYKKAKLNSLEIFFIKIKNKIKKNFELFLFLINEKN